MPESPALIESLINTLTALWFGLLGGCVGSFLNVVAYRLPLGMSVIWKPSHCPHCQHAIRIRDNVPVFGWLLLRGRCRDCGQPIAARYAVVELTLGLIFFLLAYAELFRGGANLPGGPLSPLIGAIDNVCYPNWPLLGLYAYHGTLLSMLLAILLINLDGYRVPLRLAAFGLALGLLPVVVWPWLHPTLEHPSLEPGGEVGWFQVGLHLVAGVALGALLGAGIGTISTNQRESAGQPRNDTIAMAMVGAYLGWQAAMTTTVGTLGAALVCHGLLRRWPNLHASATGLAMLAATLAQIVWWNHIADLGS